MSNSSSNKSSPVVSFTIVHPIYISNSTSYLYHYKIMENPIPSSKKARLITITYGPLQTLSEAVFLLLIENPLVLWVYL